MGKVITLSGLHMGAANPATANCLASGGTVVARKDAVGNEYGVCVFADGSECEEWALYHDECSAGGSTVTEEEKPSRLLNYGIAAGAGALAGLLVAMEAAKKPTSRLAIVGAGAGVAMLLMGIMWPKEGA